MGQLPRPSFDSVRAYGQIFTDAAYWRPYVAEVCARHGLGPCRAVRAGRPGTFPVFIVDGRVVVKFFGELFEGEARFRVEREMFALLGHDRAIPAPRLVAAGALFAGDSGWPWPYLVTEVLPGVSLAEVARELPRRDLAAIGRFLAPVVRRIHALTPGPSSPLALTWDGFDRFLVGRRIGCAERHRAWGTLPARLVAQLDGYLPPLTELVERTAAPHLLHCDLNADHILGDDVGATWQPSGIIDFGDAMAGDRLYELVALHLGLFRCDKRLLRTFLDAYGFDPGLRRDFVRRAMSLTLLHEFNVLSSVFPAYPGAGRVTSLAELATLLWDLEQPGRPVSN
jgi:hygromycin-B 7''-O-kinase